MTESMILYHEAERLAGLKWVTELWLALLAFGAISSIFTAVLVGFIKDEQITSILYQKNKTISQLQKQIEIKKDISPLFKMEVL